MALNLDLIRKEYEDAMRQVGGEYWTPKESINVVRILPGHEGKLFYKKVGVHYGLLNSKMEYCPLETLNKPCPICEFVDKLYKMKTPQSASLVNNLKVKVRYLMNIISMDVDPTKVLQFLAGKTIRKKLLSVMLDNDYGDITDVNEGRNITIEKIVPGGNKLQTEYDVRPKPSVSKLVDVNVLQLMPDLHEFVAGRVKSYDVLAELLLGSDDEGFESVDDVVSKYEEKKIEKVVKSDEIKPEYKKETELKKVEEPIVKPSVKSSDAKDDEIKARLQQLFKK